MKKLISSVVAVIALGTTFSCFATTTTCDAVIKNIKDQNIFFEKAKVYYCDQNVQGTGTFYGPNLKICVLDLTYPKREGPIGELSSKKIVMMVNKNITYHDKTYHASTGSYFKKFPSMAAVDYPLGAVWETTEVSEQNFGLVTQATTTIEENLIFNGQFDREGKTANFEVMEHGWWNTTKHLEVSASCRPGHNYLPN